MKKKPPIKITKKELRVYIRLFKREIKEYELAIQLAECELKKLCRKK